MCSCPPIHFISLTFRRSSLREFCDVLSQSETERIRAISGNIVHALVKQLGNRHFHPTALTDTPLVEPKSDIFTILDLDDIELAKQLTLMEEELLVKIIPRYYIDLISFFLCLMAIKVSFWEKHGTNLILLSLLIYANLLHIQIEYGETSECIFF